MVSNEPAADDVDNGRSEDAAGGVGGSTVPRMGTDPILVSVPEHDRGLRIPVGSKVTCSTDRLESQSVVN